MSAAALSPQRLARMRGVLARSGRSMRGLSAAMVRDPGYVAALLDPSRPSRARPTPTDLLALSDATGIPFGELLEVLWGIPRARLVAELLGGSAVEFNAALARLSAGQRASVADFAAYLAARSGKCRR